MLTFIYPLYMDACAMNGFSQNTNVDREWVANLYLETELELVVSCYFFNLTNPEEFLTGSKPIFQEVGPYAYK